MTSPAEGAVRARRMLFVVTVAVLCAVGSSTFAASREGVLSYTQTVGGEGDIMRVSDVGSDPRNLTEHPAADFQAEWSPNGARLALVSSRDGAHNLYIMNADGGNVRRLTNGPGDRRSPTWAPDGRRIAFGADSDGVRALFTVDVADGSVDKITDKPRFLGHGFGSPRWSPDGERLAIEVTDPVALGGSSTIWSLRLADRSARRLVDVRRRPGRTAADPDWSPDSRQVAYMVWEPPGRFSVAVVDADGGEEESVVERGWPCAGPTWSPDGESVAYIAMERFRTHAIWIARVDGADDRELMPAATDVYDLDWWGPELLDVGARGKRPFTWGWLKQLHTAPLGGR